MPGNAFKYENQLSVYLGSFVLFISVIPMVITYFVVSHNATETLTETLSNGLKEKSILISRNIDRLYNQRIVEIRNISQADVFETDNTEAINKYLSEITLENPHINNIEVSSLDGIILAHSSDPDEIGQHLTEFYPSMKDAMKLASRGAQGDVYLSNLIKLDDGTMGVILLTPVTDDSNSIPIKLLMLETNLIAANEIIEDIVIHTKNIQHHVYIVDNDGLIIKSTDNSVHIADPFPDLKLNPELLVKISRQDEVGSIIYTNAEGVRVIAGYSDMAEFGINKALDWSVITIAPYSQITKPAEQLKEKIAFAVILIGLIVFIIMFIVSRRIMRIIWSQANYDHLTDLPNRRLFNDRLEQAIKLSKRNKQSFALLFIDLDRFKEINDSLGHHTGDLLLKEVTNRILTSVRESDSLARMGGDEFAVILSGLKEIQFVDSISREIIRLLNNPFEINDQVIYISASIGITLYPQDSARANDLLKNADQAMYQSKASGKNRYSYFTRAMQDLSVKRHQIGHDLRIAISQEQFELHYQPIINTLTQKISKAEALIRWRHPVHGLIYPSQFIPVAEDTNLISELGDWIFEKATLQAKRWQNNYDPNFKVSINVSPVQFKSKMLTHDWLVHLHKNSLSGSSVIIEITESLLMENDPVITNQLLQLRDAGIQVAIDDFGTGYSALSYLKKFDIDYLKIDKSFIDGITAFSSDFILCEAIIIMAHKLGLKVVAEGIEAEQQLELLSSIDCDYSQGYRISKPLAVDEFDKLLKKSQLIFPSQLQSI